MPLNKGAIAASVGLNIVMVSIDLGMEKECQQNEEYRNNRPSHHQTKGLVEIGDHMPP